MKTTADIRQAFLDFFAERGHAVVPSAGLVPGNDPTLLFTNAGMVQFKDVFLGAEKRSYTRAVSSQRCVRAGGKHNDLDQVGYTARHHTFFEMLGNFSFGDYFKREAIHYAWEFLTGVCGLPAERLWVTVYEKDDEAAAIWLDEIGVDPARLSRIGEKDNFWAMGDTGPCGPCTEIFYDHGSDIPGGPPGTPEEDGDRYVEIWNLVFMQFDRAADGTLTELPKPCVDTGMGLERLATVLQGVHSNYDIDLFVELIRAAGEKTGTSDLDNPSLKVIADHIRACAFLITDGVLPANDGRGYVLRRIIRRAIRHGYKLGCRDLFFCRMLDPLVELMGEAYPELMKNRDQVINALESEERKFGETLDQGMKILESSLIPINRVHEHLREKFGKSSGRSITKPGEPKNPTRAFYRNATGERTSALIYHAKDQNDLNNFLNTKAKTYIQMVNDKEERERVIALILADEVDFDSVISSNSFRNNFGNHRVFPFKQSSVESWGIDGELAFHLYDTCGFPLDLTQDIARERGLDVDLDGFEKAMTEQRERARAAGQFSAADAVGSDVIAKLTPTEFLGYEHRAIDSARIEAIIRDGKSVDKLAAGDQALVVLDRTPFYAEAGGQVGDTGEIRSGDAVFEVADTRKIANAYHVHEGRLESGSMKVGNSVGAEIDAERRTDIVAHHSATHLLHAALREILGEHVQQKGSLVAPDRLRFDFSHPEPLTDEDIRAIERRVNEQIRANASAEIRHLSFDDAMKEGALAFFGDKYGEEVRVLRFGDFSMELCGGTHVDRVGDIGLFKIIHETGISAGVRRLEAVAGRRAVAWLQDLDSSVRHLSGRLKTTPGQLSERVDQLLERSRKLEKELERLQSKLASAQGGDLAGQAEDISGIKVLSTRVDGSESGGLRDTLDQLKNKLGSGVIVLGAESGGGVRLVAGVTDDLTERFKARELVNHVAGQVGGKGGGRADFAQAGGKQPEHLDAALKSVRAWVAERARA